MPYLAGTELSPEQVRQMTGNDIKTLVFFKEPAMVLPGNYIIQTGLYYGRINTETEIINLYIDERFMWQELSLLTDVDMTITLLSEMERG